MGFSDCDLAHINQHSLDPLEGRALHLLTRCVIYLIHHFRNLDLVCVYILHLFLALLPLPCVLFLSATCISLASMRLNQCVSFVGLSARAYQKHPSEASIRSFDSSQSSITVVTAHVPIRCAVDLRRSGRGQLM